MLEYSSRKEVPKKYQFDLTDFYKNKEEWEKDLKKTELEIEKIKSFQGGLNNEKKLESFLKDYIELSSTIMNLYVYAMLNHDVDLNNDMYTAMLNKISSLNTNFETITSFFEPEIVSLSEEEYKNLFTKNESILQYKHLLDEIYEQKKHTLSQKEEKMLRTLSETF